MHSNRKNRPFYGEYAWAYDLIVGRPVTEECAMIVSWLNKRGVMRGGELLDAGCGTGRYSAELARLGYRAHGIDASSELIQVAQQTFIGDITYVSFSVCDIQSAPLREYDAVLCRGVLNDLISDDTRQAVFDRFEKLLRPGGVLVFDVREWRTSEERKRREPIFNKTVLTDRGELNFTSTTELDVEKRQLLVSERHTLNDGRHQSISEFRFVMRCWTYDELESQLARCGFSNVEYFGGYDSALNAGATDRLVIVTQRMTNAA